MARKAAEVICVALVLRCWKKFRSFNQCTNAKIISRVWNNCTCVFIVNKEPTKTPHHLITAQEDLSPKFFADHDKPETILSRGQKIPFNVLISILKGVFCPLLKIVINAIKTPVFIALMTIFKSPEEENDGSLQ